MAKQTEETQLKKQVKEYLKKTGWFVFHIRQGKHCYKGVSDDIGIREGQVVFLEFKTDKGKQSAEQILFEYQVKEHGGKYVILRSLEDAIKLNEWIKQAVY